MARYKTGTDDFPWLPNSIRIVVVGDKGTGKSSLIVAATTDSFPRNVVPVLPDYKLPFNFFPNGVPVTIVDTSSRPEDRDIVSKELKQADAVILTYDCDRPETVDRLTEYWLPELQILEVKVPVIVTGCKCDLRDEDSQIIHEQVMAQIQEIETYFECSALNRFQSWEVFFYAQKSVLQPIGPLFDQEAQKLKPRCARALKRIFKLCDHDNDGALSEVELNDLQVKYFHAPLPASEIEGVKRALNEEWPEGLNERGLTLTGFLFVNAFFIKKGNLETTWTVLRKFEYNNNIRLADKLVPASLFEREPDQSVELTNVAIDFLKGVHTLFDKEKDNILSPQEIEDLFSTAPDESPWKEAPYENAAEKTVLGGLSLDAFLSLWSLMTLIEPARSVEHLIYIGFTGDPSNAIRLTRRRSVDRKKQQSERKVFQCYVFGPNSAGKSAVFNCLLGRSYASDHKSTTDERCAVNMVHESGGAKITLVMREIPKDRGVQGGLLSSMEALSTCDVAVFVYDNSDESSWKRATDLLVEVSVHGEVTGYEFPCLLVSTIDNLDYSPIPKKELIRMTQDIGIEAPISISSRLKDFNELFNKILTVAQHPHLNIPKIDARKSYYRCFDK